MLCRSFSVLGRACLVFEKALNNSSKGSEEKLFISEKIKIVRVILWCGGLFRNGIKFGGGGVKCECVCGGGGVGGQKFIM